MTSIELREATYQALTGVLPVCLNCEYFTQYYLQANPEHNRFVPCNLGYCAHTAVSFKNAHSTCKYFQERKQNE